ncbi:MAG: tRNA (guanosine(46)-N7)-methyltransferase TrmB [Bacteroidota bacterium]
MRKVGKLEKYEQNKKSRNVIESGKENYEGIKGHWHEHFQNQNPITVELACGWGEYTLALAQLFPDRNYIGVDIKGDRVWKGSQRALEMDLQNVAFLRSHIIELPNLFAEGEVDEVWLTFPDPHPKDRNEKHRLTHVSYLQKYQQILQPDGWFRFKTDNTALFEYSMLAIADFPHRDYQFSTDLDQSDLLEDHFGIQTKYEKIWRAKGQKIKYLRCKLGG